jgi:hypothetical protein
MTIKIGKEDLEQLFGQATFREHGDDLERKYGHYLSERFPRCEEFWHFFVVPLTKRIENSAGRLGAEIYFRDGMDAKLKYIASAHYSMFVHLAYAHLHFDNPVPSSLEDIYVHLVSACDLTETLIGKWHLVKLECQKKPSKLLQKLSRKNSKKLAGKSSDERYSELYELYFSEGYRSPLFYNNIRKDFFREYMSDVRFREKYDTLSNQLRWFRNAVVHDVKVGKFVTPDGLELVPKISKIKLYPTWEFIEKVKDDKAIIGRDFKEKNVHILGSIQGLETRLNDLWEKLIQDFKEELYSNERNSLRDMFGIDLSDTPGVFAVTMHQPSEFVEISYHPESGTPAMPNNYGFEQSVSSATISIITKQVKGSDENDTSKLV